MKRFESVDTYIAGHPEREKELEFLRSILSQTELHEEIKWGAPCYTLDKKNVVGIAAFKSYVGLWFHHGVFLKDEKGVLYNANEEETRGLRQWRFKSIEEMDADLIKAYIDEAIANQRSGKEIKPKEKRVDTPIALKDALAEDSELKRLFESLTPFKQKEYKEHIGSAKQEKTRLSRLEKAIPLIKAGKGLNDKYRK